MTTTSVEQLARQILGWLEIQELVDRGDIDPTKAFYTPQQWRERGHKNLPATAVLVFVVHGTSLSHLMMGCSESHIEAQNSFDAMLAAHGYWNEMENSDVMFIYPLSALNKQD